MASLYRCDECGRTGMAQLDKVREKWTMPVGWLSLSRQRDVVAQPYGYSPFWTLCCADCVLKFINDNRSKVDGPVPD